VAAALGFAASLPPARYDGLDGMPFPGPPSYFPTKEEMADYLEDYARLPASGAATASGRWSVAQEAAAS
jgi:hypothetical protein